MNPEENNIKTNEYPAAPGRKPASPRVKKNRKKLLIGGAVAGAFIVGAVAGSAGGSEPETVTKEVVKEVPVEKEVVKEVPVTPEACSAALDQAEKNYEIYSQGLGIAGEMLGAVNSLDASALESLNLELDGVTTDLETGLLSYHVDAMECRG